LPCADGCGATGLPAFEIVIVADQAGIAAVADHALGDQVKSVPFDTPNISAARNAGIAMAAGNVIAFIDDDAVPEPSWLTHLTAPFADPAVAASGGYVIGRNGISFQWKGRTVDRNAQTET
jgi:glycosyltransferase involved in cell wall biosynthesis